MADDEFVTDDNDAEDGVPEILMSVSQSISLKRQVAEGKFASFDDAIAASKEELHFTKVGKDWFSAEALERLENGIRQADRGELISGEEVMAQLDAWIKEAELRHRA